MAQLLLIKDANTAMKDVGDIVGFFEDAHKFSDDEKVYFTIQQVKGYTMNELVLLAKTRQSNMSHIYRIQDANKWSLDRPEQKIAWKNADNKWYFLEKEVKFYFTTMNMTQSEKNTLASDVSTPLDRLNALAHLESKLALQSENMIEVTELNGG